MRICAVEERIDNIWLIKQSARSQTQNNLVEQPETITNQYFVVVNTQTAEDHFIVICYISASQFPS
jgi:hypothetical protein